MVIEGWQVIAPWPAQPIGSSYVVANTPPVRLPGGGTRPCWTEGCGKAGARQTRRSGRKRRPWGRS